MNLVTLQASVERTTPHGLPEHVSVVTLLCASREIYAREAVLLALASAFLMQIAENSCQLPLSNQWTDALSLLRTELGASVRCRGDVNGMSALNCHAQKFLDTPCFQPRNRL